MFSLAMVHVVWKYISTFILSFKAQLSVHDATLLRWERGADIKEIDVKSIVGSRTLFL